jgi:hypothetical protein
MDSGLVGHGDDRTAPVGHKATTERPWGPQGQFPSHGNEPAPPDKQAPGGTYRPSGEISGARKAWRAPGPKERRARSGDRSGERNGGTGRDGVAGGNGVVRRGAAGWDGMLAACGLRQPHQGSRHETLAAAPRRAMAKRDARRQWWRRSRGRWTASAPRRRREPCLGDAQRRHPHVDRPKAVSVALGFRV